MSEIIPLIVSVYGVGVFIYTLIACMTKDEDKDEAARDIARVTLIWPIHLIYLMICIATWKEDKND